MNRKLISFAVAAAMFCSQAANTVSVFAADTAQAVYSCDFSKEGDIGEYRLYDDTNTEGSLTYDAQLQRLTASFGSSHSWNDKNGIKTDITKSLEGCVTGDKIKASLDFTSTYWSDPIGKARLFLEVVNASGTKQITIYEGPESVSANDETVTISGETAEYSYTAGDNVYLCVTQGSGMHYYDNIAVFVEKGQSAEKTVVNDNFTSGDVSGYVVYDSANTGAQAAVNEDGTLGVNFGAAPYDWNESNGVKKDITELVESGSRYDISADVYSSWWGGVNAKLFFEIKSGDTRSARLLAEDMLEIEGNGSVSLKGEANLTFNEGDKVYLCITQAAGYQTYDNIVVKYVVEAQPSETIPPEVTDVPDDGTVLSDDFTSGDVSGYVVYDSANTGAQAAVNEDGTLGVNFGAAPYDWNESNGVKKDITELVESGSRYDISADVYSSWWGEVNAKLFFEIKSGDTTTRVDIAEDMLEIEGDGSVSLKGEANLTFNEGDKVYLCITQAAGYQTYDNIVVKYVGKAQPSETIPPEVTDVPDDGTVLSDDFTSGDVSGYVVYDSANTGAQAAVNEDGTLGVNFGAAPYDWNESNGVKKDITELVESGSRYDISADVYSSWWGGVNAKLFFEIKSGDTTTRVDIAEDMLEIEGDGSVSLKGEANLTFNEGDKVYLCITQAAGYQTYDNIVVKYVGKAQPSETIPPAVTDVPDDGTVINDDFAKNGDTAGYTVYDSANTGAELSAEGVLGVNFGTAPYDWNENNGVKKDITELVESGSKYEASADVYSSWWGGVNAKLFFEIESGGTKTRVPIAEDGNAEGDGSMSLSGKADLWFENGDKVYICITQAAGYQTYDNIVVKYTGEADPKPQETDAPPAGSASPVPTLEPIENAIFNDDFSSADQAESYAIYDSNNTTAGVGISIDNGELAASMGAEGWNASNGIRRDITELVKQYISGVTFGVQLGMTAFWGENNDTPATVFFETVGENGTSTVTEIGTMVPTDGSETATMRGSAQLSYTDGDRIYLCVTQMSGNHRYDNIAMWLENENGEGIIPLTSGMSYTGTYFPESADAIFKHTFSGNAAAEMEQYSAYNEVAYVTAEPRDGGAFFEFPEGGTSTRGVVVDITEAIENNIPNGGQVRISCKMLPWWWWGSASIKVRTGGTISDVAIYTANTGDPGGVWATIGEVIDLAHTPGEKVELIITMDSSSATGITIDDVCVELPYKDVTARDIAVSDVSKLADVSKVSIVYGGKFVTEADVDWGDPDPGADVVYGTTSITGVMARAVITDSAVKVKVTPDGVSTEDIKLEYGKAVTASGDNEMVFLLDSMDRINLISAVSGTGIYSEPEKERRRHRQRWLFVITEME